MALALEAEINKEGFVQFNMAGASQWIRVGQGFLEIGNDRSSERLEREHIKTLTLQNGYFTIHSNGARWFSSQGKHGFRYAELGNARLFLIAVQKLLGYRLA
jgi:hypothetical protein